MIIPRKEALQARLEELGGIWEEGETLDSLEKRLLKMSIGFNPQFYKPNEAKNLECFGFFYDEKAEQCLFRFDCKFANECFDFTRATIEKELSMAGVPHKREF